MAMPRFIFFEDNYASRSLYLRYFWCYRQLIPRKLMPALYHLDVDNRLPKGTRILAIGRRDWDQAKWLR